MQKGTEIMKKKSEIMIAKLTAKPEEKEKLAT